MIHLFLLNLLLTLHYIIPFIHHFQFKMNVYKQGKTYTRDTNVYSKDLRFKIETTPKIVVYVWYNLISYFCMNHVHFLY